MIDIESELLITSKNLEPPDPINIEDFSAHNTGELLDTMGRRYSVLVFEAGECLPTEIAQWLKFRTFTENSVGANHEGDKTRFNDIESIKSRFLADQGGRALTVTVSQDTGRLYGASWLHVLQENESDMLLAVSAEDYMINKLGLENFELSEVATFATREYGIVHEKRPNEMNVALGSLAIADYFIEHNQDCKLVIGRYSEGDNLHAGFNSANQKSEIQGNFKVITKGIGYIIMGVLHPDLQELHPQYS